jgi:hypothetical protein
MERFSDEKWPQNHADNWSRCETQVRQQEKDIMALRSMATSSAPVPVNVDSIRRELDAVNERIKRVDASLEMERKQVREIIIIHHPSSIHARSHSFSNCERLNLQIANLHASRS